MPKVIKLNESSFKRLLEYIGDEEALGRYDIKPNDYPDMPPSERASVDKQTKGTDVVCQPYTDDDWEGIQYMGTEFNDPGPYDEYKKRDYIN